MHDELQYASEVIKKKRLYETTRNGLNFIAQRKKSIETLKVLKFLRKSAEKTVKSNFWQLNVLETDSKLQKPLQEENYAYN